MARIRGPTPAKARTVERPVHRIVYSLTRRKVGRIVMPVQVTAHHPKLLWGYGQMEQSLASSHLGRRRPQGPRPTPRGPLWSDRPFELISVLRSADKTASRERRSKLYRIIQPALSSPKQNRVVLEYADAMTRTPVEVSDALFGKLRGKFNEAQLVELTATLAWENYRARFDHALGNRIGGFHRRQFLRAARARGRQRVVSSRPNHDRLGVFGLKTF